MQAKRVIAKQRRTCRDDLLSRLPWDLAVQIIDQLRADDLARLPLVCKKWAGLFTNTFAEPSFGALVRQRFGLRDRPPHVPRISWGELYLALRRESCHLCPNRDVAPFVYAGSSTLSMLLLRAHELTPQEERHAGFTLFPVCKRCFAALLDGPTDSFVPVVERSAVRYLFPDANGIAIRDLSVDTGFMYSDIPGFTGNRKQQGVEYVLARSCREGCAQNVSHNDSQEVSASED